MTVKSKKRRLKRAHAHQAFCKGKTQFFGQLELAGGKPLVPWQKGVVIHSLGELRNEFGTTTGRFSNSDKKTVKLPPLLKETFKDFKPTHADTEFGTIELTTVPIREFAVGEVTPPSRAKCPTCGFSQKVRKNGTMSRHDVYVGSDPRECEGSGRNWNG